MSNHQKTILVALAILLRRGHQGSWEVMLQQREEHGLLNGKLEFPGGKINPGETAESASKRELFEETGLNCDNFKLFKIYNFTYSDRRVQLYVCVSSCASEINNSNNHILQWFVLHEKAPTPSNLIEGSQAIWSDLIQYFASNGELG